MTPNQKNLHGLAEEILQDNSNNSFRIKVHNAFRKHNLAIGLWADAYREVCEILNISSEQANSRGRFYPHKLKRKQPSRKILVGIENSLPRGDRD